MNISYKKFYGASVAGMLLISVYPLYMAGKTLAGYLANGYVNATDYPKYIIPYAPICIALLVVVCLMPLLWRLCKKRTLLCASVLGAVLFFLCEFGFERIAVVEGFTATKMPLESWQLSLCVATPEVLQSIGEPIYAANNPAYKLHFYLISLVIILGAVNVECGLTRMLKEHDFSRKRPLTVQLISVVLFVGLCLLACFTAFYRNGTINISSVSAVLMSLFFIVFGITSGAYFGSIFYHRRKLLAVVLPALVAMLTTAAMYVGELILMNGKVFSFGRGLLFVPVGHIPLAAIDFMVIALSGAITYTLMWLLNRRKAASA